MGYDRSQDFKPWFLFFTPCLLWGFVPWADMYMMTSFVLSQLLVQVLYYSSEHLKGLLFICTLLMLLWTRNILLRWYRKQIMTIDFFGKLLYLGVSILLSLMALFLVWLPLQDAYDCLMDQTSGTQAHEWKDWMFLVIAFLLASMSVSHTDICTSPSRMEDKEMPKLMNGLAVKIVRLLRIIWRALKNSHFALPYYLLTCTAMGQQRDCTEDEFDSDSDICDSQEELITCLKPATPNLAKQPSVSPSCPPTSICDGQPSVDTGSDRSGSDKPKKVSKQPSEYSAIISTSEMLYRCVAPGGGTFNPPSVTGNACVGLKRGEDFDAASTKSDSSYAGSISRSLKSVIDSTSALLGRCILPWATNNSQIDQHLQKTKEKEACAAKYRAKKDNQSDDSQSSDPDEEDDADAESNSGMHTSSSISENNEAGSDSSQLHSVSEAMTSSSVNKSQAVAYQKKGKHKPERVLPKKSTTSSISSSQRSIYDSTSTMLKNCFMPSKTDADMTQDGSKQKKPRFFGAGYRRNTNTSGGVDSDSQTDHNTSSSTARSSQEDRASGSDSTDSCPSSRSLASTSSSLRRPRLPHDQQRGRARAAGSRNSDTLCEESGVDSEDASCSIGTSSTSEQEGFKKTRGRSANQGQRFTMNLRPRVPSRQATPSSSLYYSMTNVQGRRPLNGPRMESGSQPKRTVVVENSPKSRCKNFSQPKRI